MQKTKSYCGSPEKLETHRRLNERIIPWITNNFHHGGRLITMPANSGRQEIQLLDHILMLEKQFSKKSKIKLYTFDKDERAEGTNIPMQYHNTHLWEHFYCKDIFTELLRLSWSPAPTAAWFDMVSAYSDQVRGGMTACVDNLFAHGSLLFTTFKVSSIREIHTAGTAAKLFNHATSGDGAQRIQITDEYLRGSVAYAGKKYLVGCADSRGGSTIISYRRPVEYLVCGFIVADVPQPPH